MSDNERDREVLADEAPEQVEGAGGAPVPEKRKSRKKLAIAGGIVLVIVLAGVGFYQWHNTPEFCTGVCHTPMNDAYRQTLYAKPGASATDKWGNRVEKADAMLASVHGALGERCVSCHVPVIQEQVSEAASWVSGNYYNPMSERDLARLVAFRGLNETGFCLNVACHDVTKADLTDKTADRARNPHAWHHVEYSCSDCHKAHRASVMVCSECHEDAEVPDGWLTAEGAKGLEKRYMSWNDEQFLKS